MKRTLFRILLVLVSGLTAAGQDTSGITNGMSRADVFEILGAPKGIGGNNKDEMLLFANGTVTLRNGRVVSSKLMSSQQAEERQRFLDEQRRKLEEARRRTPPPPSQTQPPAGPAADAAPGNLNWQTDFAKASAAAAQSKRYMLLDFTGSDWCHFCIKLDAEVFSTPEFKSFAAGKLVCVKVDFPKKTTLSENLTNQNKELAVKHTVQGYPTVIILSPAGELVGRQGGYGGEGQQKYIEQLKSIIAGYEVQHPLK